VDEVIMLLVLLTVPGLVRMAGYALHVPAALSKQPPVMLDGELLREIDKLNTQLQIQWVALPLGTMALLYAFDHFKRIDDEPYGPAPYGRSQGYPRSPSPYTGMSSPPYDRVANRVRAERDHRRTVQSYAGSTIRQQYSQLRPPPQVGPPPYDERYERNALDIFSDGLDNLFRDPFGWLFNVPSAMHSTMDRAFGGVERMPQPSNSALSSSAREARRRWMDGPTLGS
jgi:hypothetical protein